MRKFWLVAATLTAAAFFTGIVRAEPAEHAEHASFMVRLDQLGLSDAQWLSIHKIMVARRAQSDAMHHAERELWHSVQKLNPEGADYQTQVQAAETLAAQLAEQRVQSLAVLKQQVYAVLTPAQKARLAALPQPDREGPPPPPGE
jgi:Spy/CpxP family protein refolding chaperone